MTRTGLVRSEWEDFADSVIPEGMCDDEYSELRACFYMGVIATVAHVRRISASSRNLYDVNVLLAEIEVECQRYKNDYEAGIV